MIARAFSPIAFSLFCGEGGAAPTKDEIESTHQWQPEIFAATMRPSCPRGGSIDIHAAKRTSN